MKVLTDNKYYGQIANVIREQNGTNNTYTPPQMVSALKDLFYEEVEGVPPITFQGIGENLLDYRIDGASGGVGDRTDNLFDGILLDGYYTNNTLTTLTSSTGVYKSLKVNLPAGTYTVVYSEAVLIIRYIELNGDYMTNPAGKSAVESYTFTLNNNSTISLGFRNSTNTQWDDSIKIQVVTGSIVPSKYEPYGYKVPVVVNGKNLLKNTANSLTLHGVTFTVNNDKSITCNGTASSMLLIVFSNYFEDLIVNNEYIFSGCPPTGSISTYRLQLVLYPGAVYNIFGEEKKFTYKEEYVGNPNKSIRIVIEKDCVCNNLTFYPMIRLASIEDNTYEPYHEPTTTNIYLDKPIEAKANIPSEYEEVEYIESTGTQYIDTNYTPVQGDDLEFKNVTINNFNGALFSAGIESYQLILLGLGSVCYYKYFQTGNAVASSFSTITNGNIKVLNGNLYINNVLKAEADYGGAVDTTLNIFRRANNTSNLIGKIGEIIISNNGIIKRDFIPCYRKSDNVAGLYDLVNNVFYTNQGTGNFIVGSIKENESISLSDTNTNIPTIRGTNVLTVDTTVQPSNVYVKARKESQYETIMRERYEEAQAQLDALESEGE